MSKQRQLVYDIILDCIHQGITDKVVIFNVVQEKTNLPRPTIRRTARDLRLNLLHIIKILQSNNRRKMIGINE